MNGEWDYTMWGMPIEVIIVLILVVVFLVGLTMGVMAGYALGKHRRAKEVAQQKRAIATLEIKVRELEVTRPPKGLG